MSLTSRPRLVLLTGAHGRLGTMLKHQLTAPGAGAGGGPGATVVTISREKSRAFGWGTLMLEGHPLSAAAWDRLRMNTEVTLIHCGFPTAEDPPLVAAALAFTAQLFRDLPALGVDSVINISSQSVYAATRERPARETTPVAPQGTYGIGKYAVETLAYVGLPSSPVTSVRLASLIGPRYPQRFLTKLIRAAVTTGVIRISGGTQVFGLLDGRDASAGIIALLATNSEHWPPVLNLGPHGEGLSLAAIAAMVQQRASTAGVETALETLPGEDRFSSALNSRLFESLTGWSSELPLERSIDLLIELERSRSASADPRGVP